MAVMYSVLELSTAVKPWLLRWMLARRRRRRGLPRPGHAPLRAAGRDVPGRARPRARAQPALHRPDAARRPQAQRAGHPDRGRLQPRLHRHRLAARSPTTLLDWWGVRLERDCIVDPERGFFVDQRWIDLVPGMADDFYVLRDPGFNVAYWNLPTRTVERARRALVRRRRAAEAVPLQRLRRLEAAHALQAPGPHPADRRAGAGEAVRAATPPSSSRTASTRSRAGRTATTRRASGVPLDRSTAALYRDLMADGFDESLLRARAARPRSPSAATAPAERGGEFGVTRYLATLCTRCAATSGSASPTSPTRPTRAATSSGRTRSGATRCRSPRSCCRRVPDLAQPRAATRPSRPPAASSSAPAPALGVNVVGYLNSELGVGEVARQVIDALDAAACRRSRSG